MGEEDVCRGRGSLTFVALLASVIFIVPNWFVEFGCPCFCVQIVSSSNDLRTLNWGMLVPTTNVM